MGDSFQLDISVGCLSFSRVTDVSALSAKNLIAVVYVGEEECKLYYAEGEYTFDQCVEAHKALDERGGEEHNWMARVKAPDAKQVELMADDMTVGSIYKDIHGEIIFEEFLRTADGSSLADIIQSTLEGGFGIGLDDRDIEFEEIDDIRVMQKGDFLALQLPDDEESTEIRIFRSEGPSSAEECDKATLMLNHIGINVRVLMVLDVMENKIIIGLEEHNGMMLSRRDDGSLDVINLNQFGGTHACH